MSDLHIWNQLKEGRKEALELIYRQYAEDLLRYGSKFSPDNQLVEDCIQDLFIELWKNRAGLSKTDSIKRYLLVAIRRKIIRQHTKSKRIQFVDEPKDYNFEVTIAIDEELIAAESSLERVTAVNQAIKDLSNRQREAIYLKYQMGLDYEDLCETMEINYQSARNLISGALRKLKAQFSMWTYLLYLLVG